MRELNATKCKRRDFYEPQLFHDHFQNFKSYNIPRAQLVIADVPYNLGKNAYASNPSWYKDGDNKIVEIEQLNEECCAVKTIGWGPKYG